MENEDPEFTEDSQTIEAELLIEKEELVEDLSIIENELSIEEFSNFGVEVPQMNVSMPNNNVLAPQNDVTHLISDEKFLKVLDETIDNIKEDRKQVSDYIDTFADLVINEGDASSSTKEAFVNLLKIKTQKCYLLLKSYFLQ